MKYVAYDYEGRAGSRRSYWHIYTLDGEPAGVDFGSSTVLTIEGPETEELRQAIAAIVDAIDSAIDLVARRQEGSELGNGSKEAGEARTD